jgi:acyl-CoA synthetase
MPLIDPAVVADYTARGWWGTRTLSDLVRRRARENPDAMAYVTPDRRTTWADYDREADGVAQALVAHGLEPGDRAAVLLPDSELVHVALIGFERAGVVAAGLGWRAGSVEIDHLVRRTKARVLVTTAERAGEAPDLDKLVIPCAAGDPVEVSRALGPNDLWLLNSTSGTTGMPKVVTQFQNRWIRFLEHAVDTGGLGEDERLMSVIPAPFGFGLWTTHVAPAYLGAPTVVLPRFDVETMARMIAEEQVTVLCCVSTQFRMLLNSPSSSEHDLSSLRVMFTGGEMIPPDRAAEFEERTGAVVLSFFGSNESGAFTATRHDDPRDKRLTTVGRAIPEMNLKLYDASGAVVSGTGIPGGHGPLACAGYYDDPEANAKLYAPDGAMLMGDLVSVDEDGYVSVVGRTSDIIIRGGKNISAVQVETEVDSHPLVDAVGIVPVTDAVFGEKVCAVVTLVPGASLTLAELTAHLAGRLGRESWPEHLIVLDELPRSSGGKLAKGDLRKLAEGLL